MVLPSLIGVILVLIVVGVLWYCAENYIPMPPPMKIIVRVVCLVAVVLYLLRVFALL